MSIKTQAKRFWRVFLEERVHLEKALDQDNQKEVQEIVRILNTYFEEFSNSSLSIARSDEIYELTFHSGQDKNVQLVCAVLKELAPKAVLDNWIINAYLPPLSEQALHTMLKLKDKEYYPEDFIVYYSLDDANKSFHVQVYCAGFALVEPQKANEIAVYMLQLFIGECALEAYIGNIDVVAAQQGGNAAILPDFYEVMLEAIEAKKWPEYYDPTAIYRVYQLHEEKVCSDVRKDMKLIFTVHPILISELLNDEFVTYHQFFDFGGEFGYLYYRHSDEKETAAMYRQQLEKKLNELLFPHGIAKSIGGAMGTTYAYIDLAIYDKTEFLKVLDKINQKLSLTLTYRSFEDAQ